MKMSFLNTEISFENVDFSQLPSDFIDIDNPPTTQYGYTPASNVIKGFVVNSSIDSTANITFKYTPTEASGKTEDNFNIYKCSSWDYENRNCNNSFRLWEMSSLAF